MAGVVGTLEEGGLAGHRHTVFPTTYAELVGITRGTPADVGE